MNHKLSAVLALTLLSALNLPLATAHAQGTAFTYQGRLNSSGSPASGSYDLQFSLWSAASGPAPLGSPLTNTATPVSNGLFTVALDFGNQFPGADRWLEIAVRPNGGGEFSTLTPRQFITPSPYAIMAGSVSGSVHGSLITPGSVPDSGLSTNVALRNGGNTFSGNQVITAGNVGIGTTNPGTKLEVVGTIKATAFSGAFAGDGSGLVNLGACPCAPPPVGMVLIPAGAYTMGSTNWTNSLPISGDLSAFYMDVNLVTYSQWQAVFMWADDHGGYVSVHAGAGKLPNHPVQTVDWYDCVKWCNARSEQAGRTPVYYTDAALTEVYRNGEPLTVYPNWAANGYRLPTEAEWEKAARGGLSGELFPWGSQINQSVANYLGGEGYPDRSPYGYNEIGSIGGSSPATSPVGSFAANLYGLNDMAGNVFEWCWDWYDVPYAGGRDPHGPAGPLDQRVLRGGAWSHIYSHAACAARNHTYPIVAVNFIGFRCVRGL